MDPILSASILIAKYFLNIHLVPCDVNDLIGCFKVCSIELGLILYEYNKISSATV